MLPNRQQARAGKVNPPQGPEGREASSAHIVSAISPIPVRLDMLSDVVATSH